MDSATVSLAGMRLLYIFSFLGSMRSLSDNLHMFWNDDSSWEWLRGILRMSWILCCTLEHLSDMPCIFSKIGAKSGNRRPGILCGLDVVAFFL